MSFWCAQRQLYNYYFHIPLHPTEGMKESSDFIWTSLERGILLFWCGVPLDDSQAHVI